MSDGKDAVSMKRVFLIINPNAGKMRSRTAMFEIVSRFCDAGYRVEVQTTRYKGHAAELAKFSASHADLCVCCGGDGTLNETVSGMMEAEHMIPIGYIPCGTTNDFANSMNIPTSVKKAANAIIEKSPVKVDIGKMGERYFTYIASFGAFASTSYTTPQSAKNTLGHFAYILEGIRDMSKIQPYTVKVKANGVEYSGDYIFGAVSNSTSVAGIVRLDNTIVDMCDGLFETVLVKFPSNPVETSRILHGIATSDFSSEMFDFFRTSEISFEMEGKVPWTLDGEFFEGETRLDVVNLHGSIEIIA